MPNTTLNPVADSRATVSEPMRSKKPLWRSVPVWVHAALLALALGAMAWVNVELQTRYDATGYPVTFFEGQTTFSGDTVKGHFAELDRLGTLGVFADVQRFDFAFMASVAIFGLLGGLLIVRLTSGRVGRWVGYTTAIAAVTGAVSDAIENLVSFIMLANPTGFADALAVAHSSFAVIKFAGLTFAMAAGAVGLVLVVVHAVRRQR